MKDLVSKEILKGYSTKCVHSDNYYDDVISGAMPPIFNSTANSFDSETGHIYYPRYLNMPTQKSTAKKIASLENAEDGLLFSSGMGAISAALFSLLPAGSHVIFAPDLYGGTHFLVTSEFERAGIRYSFAKSNKIEDFAAEIRDNTRIIYIETPSNPLLKIIDIKAVANFARKNNILTIIDNTFASPINQNPYSLGIDIVVHSGTKYLNGHSDLICGAIVSSSELIERIRPYAINHGATLSVQSCYLLERGIRTLALRIHRHNENALALSRYLESHKLVHKVYYPGLESHPDHIIAKSQMSGFGGMLSFELACDKKLSKNITSKLTLAREAGSLGGVESTLCYPSETSHAKMSPEDRLKAGITDSLIRFSVGIEETQDLIADIEAAMSV